MTLTRPNYLPKVSFPDTITLEGRALTKEFGGDRNIQAITDVRDGGRLKELDPTPALTLGIQAHLPSLFLNHIQLDLPWNALWLLPGVFCFQILTRLNPFVH